MRDCPRQRDIGIVFRISLLAAHERDAGIAFHAAHARRLPQRNAERRVSEALARVGLNGFAERKPSEPLRRSAARGGAGAGDRHARRGCCLMNRSPTWTANCANRCGEMSRLLRQLGITALYVTH